MLVDRVACVRSNLAPPRCPPPMPHRRQPESGRPRLPPAGEEVLPGVLQAGAAPVQGAAAAPVQGVSFRRMPVTRGVLQSPREPHGGRCLCFNPPPLHRLCCPGGPWANRVPCMSFMCLDEAVSVLVVPLPPEQTVARISLQNLPASSRETGAARVQGAAADPAPAILRASGLCRGPQVRTVVKGSRAASDRAPRRRVRMSTQHSTATATRHRTCIDRSVRSRTL